MNSSASTILLAAAKVSEAASSAVVSVSTPYQKQGMKLMLEQAYMLTLQFTKNTNFVYFFY
jgi:hypothetical protein